MQCDAVWCSVMQCNAVSCSVLQRVAACCRVLLWEQTWTSIVLYDCVDTQSCENRLQRVAVKTHNRRLFSIHVQPVPEKTCRYVHESRTRYMSHELRIWVMNSVCTSIFHTCTACSRKDETRNRHQNTNRNHDDDQILLFHPPFMLQFVPKKMRLEVVNRIFNDHHDGLFPNGSFEKNPERWPCRILFWITMTISGLVCLRPGCSMNRGWNTHK